MIPAARISATIELLDLIDSSDAPADGVIRAYFRKRRYAGSKDRRSVTTRVFDIIRHRARLDWWLASAAGEMEPNGRGRTLAGLALIDAEQSETIAALFDGQGHNPARLSDDETTLLGNIAGKPIHHDAIGEAVLCELPDFLYQPLKALWGDNCRADMDALNAWEQRGDIEIRKRFDGVGLKETCGLRVSKISEKLGSAKHLRAEKRNLTSSTLATLGAGVLGLFPSLAGLFGYEQHLS